MNRIEQFVYEQDDRRRRKIEIDQRYREHNSELTEEEKVKLAQLKEKFHYDDKSVSVVTRQYGGEAVSVDIREYFRMVDQYMESTNNTMVEEKLKLVNKADENIFSNASELLSVFNTMTQDQLKAYTSKSLSPEELSKISLHVSEVCKKDLGRDKISSELVERYYEKEIKGWAYEDFVEHFGAEFADAFLPEGDCKNNILRTRSMFMNVIGLLIVNSDEITNLNAYIEYNERVVEVLERLAKCGEDVAEVLKSSEGFADAAARSREETGFPKAHDYANEYSEHFEIRADGSYDYFAIRYVMMRELAKAYEKVKSEYETEADIEVVDNEIQESLKKADCYLDVAELTTFKEVYAAYEASAKSDKRTSANGLRVQGKTYVEKIRKSKVNLNFPGFMASYNSANEILNGYYKHMHNVISNYNAALDVAEKEGITGLEKIECDVDVFAGVLLTVMSRLMKKLTKNTSDKFESLTVASYFKRYAQIGMDLYSLPDIYNIVKPMVEFISNKK